MKTKRISKTWWRGFFDSVVGEIMFVPRSAVTDKEVARVHQSHPTRPPSHVLDLACGVGRHSLAFARRGFAVTGLDYSAAYLRNARAAARKAKLPVAVRARRHAQPARTF